MTQGIRVVAPFRPFPAESDLHRELADFDWIEALRMVTATAARACGCPVHAITDIDTTLPVPTLRYPTAHRRLMLWTLEACAAYLASRDCDRDTVMLDVDQLVFGNLAAFFRSGVDLVVLIRPQAKHMHSSQGQPFLNGVQFWRARSRKRLARFYRRALAVAEGLPEERRVWGADTDAVRELLEPLALGIHERAGLVVEMIDAAVVLEAFSQAHADALVAGQPIAPLRPVLDFRFLRKRHMAAVYRAAFGAVA